MNDFLNGILRGPSSKKKLNWESLIRTDSRFHEEKVLPALWGQDIDRISYVFTEILLQ